MLFRFSSRGTDLFATSNRPPYSTSHVSRRGALWSADTKPVDTEPILHLAFVRMTVIGCLPAIQPTDIDPLIAASTKYLKADCTFSVSASLRGFKRFACRARDAVLREACVSSSFA